MGSPGEGYPEIEGPENGKCGEEGVSHGGEGYGARQGVRRGCHYHGKEEKELQRGARHMRIRLTTVDVSGHGQPGDTDGSSEESREGRRHCAS